MAKDRLTTYGLGEADKWDSIVRTFTKHDTYWLSGYARAFMLHGDGEPKLVSYEGADGTRGINVIIVRDVADDPHFVGQIERGRYLDAASPYGYGGWLVEGEGGDGLFAAYELWCRRTGIISEFVRFHPMAMNHTDCEGFYDVDRLGEVVHMDLTSPEAIWANMTSKNRNMVRKAKKAGIRIYNGRFPEAYSTFRLIYDATMDKDHADAYYYFGDDFYTSILEDLPHNAQVFWAELGEKPIAASIMLACNGQMDYHLSGSVREYSSFAATNLILYEAACWGCENGCKTLYLGGGVGSGEDNLFKFKRSFYRGELNRFYTGKKVFIRRRYEELCAMRNEVASTDYFPVYRG